METLYDSFRNHGLSRRDFLKFATSIAIYLGLSPMAYAKMVKELDSKPKPTVIWLELQDCAGCSESFIRSSNILPTEVLLDLINLQYHETLMSASGKAAEEAKEEAIKSNKCDYILVVEGSVTPKDSGVYCTVGGKSSYDSLLEAAKYAGAIICVGSCSSWGGLPHANPNPTGAISVEEALPPSDREKIIHIPGCPPIADVMVSVIMQYLVEGKIPKLDSLRRPVAFYGQSIHDSCYRRAFYNAGEFAKSFDDEGAKNGHCLYELGCKGPVTRNACSTIRWNGGLSFPIQSGHPCFGCSEPNFWDNGHIYEPLASPNSDNFPKTISTAVATGVGAGIVVGAISKWSAKKAHQENKNG
jgi:hydrogenase small subunit